MIQVFKPSITQAEIDAVTEVLRSGWLGLGPRTAEFERQFALYVGAKHAIATNSATAALHLSLLGLGIGSGDEVLVPTLTFVSTAHAVSYCGAKPIFVDVDADTLCISVEDAVKKMTPRTKVIMPVHYGGQACRMAEIYKLNLMVVEDAAHACGGEYGGEYRGQRIGGLSHACAFSFHAVKNLATNDGGMVTTNDDELAEKIRQLRWCGISKSTWERTEQGGLVQYGWYYEVTDLGYKCHMNDVTAAIGLVQLSRLDEMNAKRRKIAQCYIRELGELDWLDCPADRFCWHNFVIKTKYRDRLNLYLKEKGIATGVHYMPIHLQPYYKDHREDCPVAEDTWLKLLTLPLYVDLTDAEINRVIGMVTNFGKML